MSETFGAFIRKRRLASEVSLRTFAARVGISPTYLSKIERDEMRPPSEYTTKRIAMLLEADADVLLALGGRISSDLKARILANPVALAALIRALPNDYTHGTIKPTKKNPRAGRDIPPGERSQGDH